MLLSNNVECSVDANPTYLPSYLSFVIGIYDRIVLPVAQRRLSGRLSKRCDANIHALWRAQLTVHNDKANACNLDKKVNFNSSITIYSIATLVTVYESLIITSSGKSIDQK